MINSIIEKKDIEPTRRGFEKVKKMSLREVVNEIAPIPPEAFFIAQCTDGIPLLVNLDLKQVNILFYSKYDLPIIYQAKLAFDAASRHCEPRKINFVAISKTNCVDGAAFETLHRGLHGTTVAFVEDFSDLVLRMPKDKLESLLRSPNILFICNCYKYVGEGWARFFQVFRPSKDETYTTECEKSETITIYAPIP